MNLVEPHRPFESRDSLQPFGHRRDRVRRKPGSGRSHRRVVDDAAVGEQRLHRRRKTEFGTRVRERREDVPLDCSGLCNIAACDGSTRQLQFDKQSVRERAEATVAPSTIDGTNSPSWPRRR